MALTDFFENLPTEDMLNALSEQEKKKTLWDNLGDFANNSQVQALLGSLSVQAIQRIGAGKTNEEKLALLKAEADRIKAETERLRQQKELLANKKKSQSTMKIVAIVGGILVVAGIGGYLIYKSRKGGK